MSERCPCGGARYETCCGPRHDGSKPAETAEALMRSRYSAFAKGLGGYLAQTAVKPGGWAESGAWGKTVTWLGLEVLDAAQPTVVEFVARYLEGDVVHALRERSTFVSEDGRWRYEGGAPTDTTARVARNEPCPCGSGKKFKQCHA